MENYGMKKRIYFDKYGDMRFISHLDLLRFLERLFKKVNLPIKYSNGFHPRPKMSFGNPISLGTESFGEIMDIELEEQRSDDDLLKQLNSVEILGFRVQKVEGLESKGNITEEFPYIKYSVEASTETIDSFELLLLQESILETKEKKGKQVTRELKNRLVFYKRKGDVIEMLTENIAPNSYLAIAKISLKDVRIRRLGYQKNKGEELC